MRNPLKFWLGTLAVLLLALTPSVVPVGGSVAPAAASSGDTSALRFDATRSDFLSSAKWNDLVGNLDGTLVNGVARGARSKAFEFVRTSSHHITVPSFEMNFSGGFTLHAVVDFETVDSWERVIDFGNGQANGNIIFGRFDSTNDFTFNVWNESTSAGFCRTTGGTGIVPGFHTYSVVVSATGGCSLYRNGEQLPASFHNAGRAENATVFKPTSGSRSSNFIGRANWTDPGYLDGSIQSIVMYNSPKITPDCLPEENEYSGTAPDGSALLYRSLVFSTVGNCLWTPPTGITSLDYVVVGGGGAGGFPVGTNRGAGGGGAGGFRSGSATVASNPYQVSVGRGGVPASAHNGASGTPVTATGSASSAFTVTAAGGGGGGQSGVDRATSSGLAGASGGGAGNFDGVGGSSGIGGNLGGAQSGDFSGGGAGGGGGGSGGPGGNAGSSGAYGNGGVGGAGTVSTLTGSSLFYAAGGGGAHGGQGTFGAGGSGVGGSGSSGDLSNAQSGLSGTGSGGGGARFGVGGAGGSGVVVVRYVAGAAPGTVQNFVAATRFVDQDSDTDSVSLSWTALTGQTPAVTQYEIEYSTSSNFSSPTTQNVVVTNSSAATPNSATITGLVDGARYFFRIKARNAVGVSASYATTQSVPVSRDDYALDFNGNTRATGSAVIPSSGNFTVEAWIHPDSNPTDYQVIVFQGTAQADRFAIYYYQNTGFHITRDNNFQNVVVGDITGQWSHLAVSVDRLASTNNVRVYLNGALAGTVSLTGGAGEGAPFYVGIDGRSGFPYPFSGEIDQVKAWSTALSQSQVQQSMHAWAASGVAESPGLVAHYDFNDNTQAATLRDMSGTLDLTVTNATTSSFKPLVATPTRAGYEVYRFTRSYLTATGGWTVPSGFVQADYLIVAGGGGGGGRLGGGGGAGGLREGPSSVTAGSVVPVIVGVGGAGGAPDIGVTSDGVNGGASTALGLTAIGGGGGGGTDGRSGLSGGSGGGGGRHVAPGLGGARTEGQGNVGGLYSSNPDRSGGGGGAGAPGASGLASGNGGAGLTRSITGSPVAYAGGGGGSAFAFGAVSPTAGLGGAGGGGTAFTNAVGTPGVAATGGGGAGGGYVGNLGPGLSGGRGGSGVVVLAFQQPSVTATDPADTPTLVGRTTTFSTDTTGSQGTVTIQWQVSTDSGSTWLDVTTGTGGTTSTYTTPTLQASDSGTQYRVVVSAAVNGTTDSFTSEPATLTVSSMVFDGNHSGGATSTITFGSGDTITLPTPARTGYILDGWFTASSGGARIGGATDTYSPLESEDLILRYEIDDTGSYPGSGTTITDIASQVNSGVTGSVNGTISGGATFAPGGGTSLNFDGVNDYVMTGNLKNRFGASNLELSVFAWIYPTGNGVIVSEHGDPTINSGWFASQIEVEDGNLLVRTWDPAYGRATAVSHAIPLNQWHYVGLTHNGATLTAYVNGTAVGTKAYTRQLPTPDTYLAFGANSTTKLGTGGFGQFKFGSAHIYKAALTANEVADNFKATCARFDYSCTQRTAYAQWTADTYAVTFDSNGGTVVADGSFATEGSVAAPTPPDRTGFNFGGWSATDGGSALTFPYSPGVTEPITLYALWDSTIAITTPTEGLSGTFGEAYSLTIPTTGGPGGNAFSVTSGTLPAGLSLDTSSGVISGTPTAAGSSTVVVRVTPSSGATASTSSFTIAVATQTLPVAAAPTVAAPAGVLKQVEVSWSEVANASSYTVKLYDSTNAERATILAIAGTSTTITATQFGAIADNTTYSVSVTAVGTGNYATSAESTKSSVTTNQSYTVTWDSNGGSAVTSGSFVTGGTVFAPTPPTREGYTFVQWSTTETSNNGDAGTAVTFAYTPPSAANVTFHARWSANSNTVTFKSNFVGGGSDTTQSITTDVATALTSNAFTRTGYTFAGWATSSGGSVVHANGASLTLSAPLTLHAQWTANSNTVTFKSNHSGGPSDTTQSITTDVATSLTENAFTRTGYTFVGWTTAADGSGSAYANGTSLTTTSNLTLYAQWTRIKTSNLIVNLDATNPQSLAANSKEWKSIPPGSSTSSQTGQGNVAYSDTAGIRSLTFDGSGDYFDYTTVADSRINGAMTAEMWIKPGDLRSGWNILATRWFSDIAGTSGSPLDWHFAIRPEGSSLRLNLYTTSTSDIFGSRVFTANSEWVLVGFTIDASGNQKFFVNGVQDGTTRTGVTHTPSANVKFIIGDSRGPLGFNGSISKVRLYNAALTDAEMRSNFDAESVYFGYNEVTWDSNGGSSITSGSFAAGGSVAAPTPPNRSGYSFVGWSTTETSNNGDSGTAVTFPHTPGSAENITYFARWTADTYTVTFNKGSASGATGADQTSTKTHDVNLALPDSATANTYFTRSGFTVTGWSVNANGSTSDYALGANYRTEAIDTLYPVWSASTFTVTFNKGSVSGATGADQSSAKTGGVSLTLPNSATANGYFTKTGYTVTGWSVNADGSTSDFALGGAYTAEASDTLYPVWTANTYVVTFNKGSAAGATGADRTSTKTHDVSLALPDSATANTYFTRTGYTVTGWSVNANGSTTDYALGASYTTEAIDSLYPVWTANTYVVTFNKGSASGATGADRTSTKTHDVNLALPDSATANTYFTRTGYTVGGWSMSADGSTTDFALGANFTTEAIDTLYPVWTADTYVVTFNKGSAAGATGADRTSTKTHDVSLALPDSATANTYFTRTGYTVGGWSMSADGSTNDFALGANYTTEAIDTLYPVWTANTYTVTFSANGGSSVSNGSFTTGGTVVEPSAPTRTGFTFAGWSATDGGSAVSFPYSPGVTQNITLYAKWTADGYTVTFSSNGGTSVSNGAFTTGGSLTEPSAPTRSGFTFAGWSATDGGSAVSFPYSPGVTQNITLYAKWTANSYTITFNKGSVSGATGSDRTATKTGGVNLALPNSATANGYFTRPGFSVTSWSVNADGSTSDYAFGANYTTEAIDTLYPVWTANTYTITFNKGSVSGATGSDQSATKTGGVNLALPNSATANGYFTKTGYTVTSWSVNADGSTSDYALGANYTTEAIDTLYPVWTANTYTVTYNYNSATGGNSVSSVSYTVDGIRVSLPTPAKTGFTFDGWYSNVGLTTLVGGAGASYAPTGSVTLYAKWTAATFTVLYEYNGATGGNSSASATHTTGGTVITLPTPTRAGYTFGGWYSDVTVTTSAGAAGGSYSPTANLTIFAKWTAIVRTVTYNSTNTGGISASSGSVPTDGGSYIIGNTVVVKANSGTLTRTGYTFEGWVTNADGTGTALNAGETLTVAEANINLYPQWSANTYTITYNKNGGTGTLSGAPSSWQTGTSNVTLPNSGLTKTGFNFDGWQELGSTTKENLSYQPNYEDVTLVARWNIKSINYTFDKGHAVGLSITGWPTDSSANFASTITLPNLSGTTVTISGSTYLFFGWELGGTTYNSGDSYVMTETSPTFEAQWVRLFDVRFGFGGGTHSVAGNGASECDTGGLCVDGEPIVLRSAPERPGYTFNGWKVQDTNTVKAASAAHNVTATGYLFYAQWTAVNYRFTFNSLGGTLSPSREDRTIGQIVTMPSPGTRTGYSFGGWSADGGSTTYITGSSYVVGTEGQAFSAQWIPDVYAVTYDWQGGAGSTPRVSDTYTVGTGDMTLPTASGAGYSRDGYNFSGWSTSIGGSLVSGFRPTADDVLYAIWADGNYTLSYDPKGGTVGSGLGTVSRGGSVTLPTPVRDNFTFVGWFTAATGGTKLGDGGASFTPSASSTLFARWVQDSLYGVDLATLETASTYTASNSSSTDTTLTHDPTGTSARVQIPAGALPNGTVVTVRYFKETNHQSGLIPGDNTYFFALLVSWLSGTGDAATVPDTAAGKPISVTLNNSNIKAGAMVYQVIGERVTELGRATVDGTVTVQLTQDPQLVVAATKPAAPSSVSGTSGDTRATISWTAGSSGGSAITGYTVTASPGGATCSTASTSCTISSLSNNTAYTFRVVANNALGASPASSASSSVTPLGATYTVTFDANGGSAVSNGSFFSGSTVSAPGNPSRSGFVFGGWATTQDDATTKVTFPYAPGVTSAITLHALWSVAPVERGSSGGGNSSANQQSSRAPVVPPGRTTVQPQPVAPLRPITAPIVIAPERGFDPDAGSQATVGGQAAPVTKATPQTGGVSVGVGRVEVTVSPTSPQSPGTPNAPSAPGRQSDLSVSTGQSAAVSGAGLLPGSVLQVWLPGMTGAVNKELARIPVRNDGSFASELTFSPSQTGTPVPIGRQVLQVTGFDERGDQVVVDMTVTISQGSPTPELNRSTGVLPGLRPGQSLATSAGMPESVVVEARPSQQEVSVISGDWSFTVGLPETTGAVAQDGDGAAITFEQQQTATVSGDGFQPDTRVDIWLFSDPTLLGSVIVAADGSFSGEVYLDPNFAVVGEHTLQLQGVGMDGFIRAANLGVVVEGFEAATSDTGNTVLWWVFGGAGLLAVVIAAVVLSRGRGRRVLS